MKKGTYINDSIHGLIQLTDYEKRILSSVGFNRLHDVYQNSTVYLTFPSNRTKRFEHSIGTMKICSDMFCFAIRNSDPVVVNKLYSEINTALEEILDHIYNTDKYVDHYLAGDMKLNLQECYKDQFLESVIPYKSKDDYDSRTIPCILLQALRTAALLHDIGHPPYSHVVEFAMKDAYEKCISVQENNPSKKKQDYIRVMEKYFNNKHKLHEEFGKEISKSILEKIILRLNDEKDPNNTKEQRIDNLYSLLIKECVMKIFDDEGIFGKLHKSLIDGCLDSDRLDYVTRDPVNSGFHSGIIDYSRILSGIKIFWNDGDIKFCVPIKTVNSLDDFFKRRFYLYKDIIYHHRVIKTDALMRDSICNLIILGLEEKLEPNEDDDSTKKTEPFSNRLIPYDISGLWSPLGIPSNNRMTTTLSQWNDSWLMTVLKDIYYTSYYALDNNDVTKDKYLLSKHLEELLENVTYYFSLIKRGENFKYIDDSCKEVLYEKSIDIKKSLKSLREIANKEPTEKMISGRNTLVDISKTLDNIEKIITPSSGFVISRVEKNKSSLKMDDFNGQVDEIVSKSAKNVFRNLEINDIKVVFKERPIGLSPQEKEVYLYNNLGEIYSLSDVSGIVDILQLEVDYLPVFYIYMFSLKDENRIKDKRETFLKDIGIHLGEFIYMRISNLLREMINENTGVGEY